MLAITEGADEALTHIRSNIDGLPDNAGIRITQEQDDDGKPGFAIEVVDEPASDDVVIEDHPLPVFIAKDAVDELDGAALDGEVHGDHVHFGFVEIPDETDESSQNGRAPEASDDDE